MWSAWMQDQLEVLVRAVRRAGEQVLRLAAHGFETHIKKDRSPVTTADLAVNDILRDALLGAFPEDGWLSEESQDDLARLEKKRVWVVDPIDGTKYFMRSIPQYSISVALVEAQAPVVAVVYNPMRDELYSALAGTGTRMNGRRVSVTSASAPRPVILVSPPGFERGAFRRLEPHAECRPMGSIAYTLALVAAGAADATLNADGLNEWDVAAGVLLVREAGGAVVDGAGNPLVFNKPKTSVRGIVAASPERLQDIAGLASLLAS
jgi:myo-inositol-1(or 4)-monophosphatase